MGELRQVSFDRKKENGEHVHMHSHTVGPNEELVNYINSVAQQLNAYNQKVAQITHQEHLLKK